MSSQGLQYIFNKFGGDLNTLPVLYDFSVSGNYVNNVSQQGTGNHLGIISGSQSQFWATSGSGTFSNHVVTISGTSGLVLNDFAVFLWGNRQNNARDNVLFSSIEDYISGIASGGHVFINPANKLVFLFKTCVGTQSYISDFNVISDFAVGVSKSNSVLNLYQYDYYNQSIATNSFTINRFADYFPINHFSIGYGPSGANLINNQFYSGSLNTFLLVSGGVNSNNAQLIFSGRYVETQTTSPATISGNECTGLVTLGGSTTVVNQSVIPSGMFFKQGILIFSQPLIATDLVLLDCATTGQNLFNQKTLTNPGNSYSLGTSVSANIGLYLNGQRLISGASSVTGSFCTTGTLFPKDYDIANKISIIGINNLIATDVLKYDVQNANILLQTVLSSGTGTFAVSSASGIGYYVNGIRNLNFDQVGTGITPQSNLNNGDVILVDYFNNGYIKNNVIASTNPYLVSGGFVANTSMVYLNGQRLSLNVDYIEINSGEFPAFTFKPISSTAIFDASNINNTWNI